MNEIEVYAFRASLVLGILLLLAVVIRYIKNGESSATITWVGLVLVVLPVATNIKIGKDGVELELRSEIAVIEAKIEGLKKVQKEAMPHATLSLDDPVALVFYTSSARENAKNAIDILKSNDYLASGIPTDFSELGSSRSDYSGGSAYVRYTPNYKGSAEAAKQLLLANKLATSVVFEEVKSFKNGDIQIGLF